MRTFARYLLQMTKQQSPHYWKTLPDRDEALEVIYGFIRAFHDKRPDVIEDLDWDEYIGKNLAYEVEDPSALDEDLMLPEFSGKHFVLDKNEIISVQIGMREQVTPIRLHFALLESDELYYIKLQRITSK